MSNILDRLRAGLKGSTIALLGGGVAPELTAPASEPSAAAGAEAAAALANAVEAGAIGAVPAAEKAAGGGKKKDKAGRMPGDEGYDESDPADEDTAAAAPSPAPAAATAGPDAIAAAVAAEQARWAAVMASPEMAGREELAKSLLASTTLNADTIIAQLKAAPKAQAAASVAAMLGHDNPDLGAGGDAGPTDKARIAAGWEQAIAAVTGNAPGKK